MSAVQRLPAAVLERFARGTLIGGALFWLGAIVMLRGDAVPDWWLPVALGIGWALPVPAPVPGAAPRWLVLLAAALLLTAFAAVTYGAIATPSRHWDGAASFDAKVFWLVQAPTLQQPFFADPAVFHHSPDYPLLLPLLTAAAERLLGGGLGRLMMPLLYALAGALLFVTARRRGIAPWLATASVLAFGLTPALLGPGGGAVDSGYSELPLLVATTAMASGLLLRSSWLLGLGVVLAVAAKPEGLPYGMVAALAAFVVGERRLLAAALVALAGAVVLWLPLQQVLLHADTAPGLGQTLGIPIAIGIVAAALLLADALARRAPAPQRWRLGVALGLPLLTLAMLPLLQPLLPAQSAIGLYVQRGTLVFERLATLPAIAAGGLDAALLRGHYGATFVLPLVAAIVLRRRRLRLEAGALPALVLFGLLAVALPFLLSPEDDLQHHLRSSMPRLLLHWLGPLWLLAACQLDAVLPSRATPTAPAIAAA